MSVLAKNAFLLTIASVGQKALAFIYFAFIAARLGDERLLGAYFLALALTTTVGVLDDLGMTSVVIREVARAPEKAKDLLRSVLGWKLCAMPITVLLGFFLPPVLHFSHEAAELVHLAIVVMIMDTLSVTWYGVLRGLHVVKYEALGVLLGQTLTALVGGASLIFFSGDLRLLILALIVGSTWNAVFAAYHVAKRLGTQALIPAWTMGVRPLRMGFMFFLAAIFVKLYSYIDSFTITRILGQGAVGTYSVAYKLTYAFQFLPLAFVGALYPAMSAQINDARQLRETFLQAEWYVALLAAPVIGGLWALAPEVIGMFYGDRYREAVPVLRVLLLGLWFIFLDFPVGSLLNASGLQAKKTLAMGLAMVCNACANMILIREFGIVGAAYAAVMTFVLLFCVGIFFARQVIELSLKDWLLRVGGITLSGIIMALSVVGMKVLAVTYIHPLAWILVIPLGAGIFFCCGWMFGGITSDHVHTVRRLVKRSA